MTEPVEDLAGWLTAVWDEEEAIARTFDWAKPEQYETPTLDASPEYVTLYMPPNQALARIAADRKILEIHSYHMTPSFDSRLEPIPGSRRPHCDTCASQDENGEYWPCETVRLLASPYADRPGFRPEWLVERQGERT